MVVLEGMASGVPVAAARVGGVPDLVRHGETGLLFDPSNEEAVANAVAQLVSADHAAMVARAKKEALQRFHPDIIAARHVEIYREVIAQARR